MWTTEIFSANVRTQAVGMASQFQNVANTILQQFFPTFLANDGLKCLFFFMSANFCLSAFVYFFIPETKGVILERMDHIFGGIDHTEKGANLLGVTDEITTVAGESKEGARVHENEHDRQDV